ncbi:MAG: hypothetical protein HY916_10465 [Desulfovibrio sp.]|nr:hypothetical protein [Desulfovibrio sp.]
MPTINSHSLTDSSKLLVAGVLAATNASPNEANLRHEIEHLIRRACAELDIPYAPFSLERALRGDQRQVVFADVVHGGVIIEYEPPKSFNAGRNRANVQHAKDQAEGYAARMAHDEGRAITEYVMIIWDGAHIAFGATDGNTSLWERLVAFDAPQAARLLTTLRNLGRPLAHPALLRSMIGPESELGGGLIPALFQAVVSASARDAGRQTKTTLLFKEWNRLFGQAIGIPTDRLYALLERQSEAHRQPYEQNIPCYLFALHTYLAMVAKLVAALALPNPSENIRDSAVALRERIRTLESGSLFANAGIVNMLGGDFFSWPVDDPAWARIERPLASLLAQLGQLSFDMTRRNPSSVRDLFKGIYEQFVPRELRHALGEINTPDWLAGHVFDQLGWEPDNDLLDPTCGTGTFLLEAIRRRIVAAHSSGASPTAGVLLAGIYGMDLNPLAVLATKASLVVMLAQRLDPAAPVRLPVFLADAINTATPTDDGFFSHTIQTEQGEREFRIPESIVRANIVHEFFDDLRLCVAADLAPAAVLHAMRRFLTDLPSPMIAVVEETINVLVDLHRDRWDGIWCPILADRFAAGAVHPVSHIAGNPPWVKWSNLPTSYASFVKPLCQAINVFSEDTYVGGIEADVSTIITFQAVRKWLAPSGRLGFLITATVFSTESSQGFRRFAHHDGTPMCAVLSVEDFKGLKIFDGVTNHPALLIVEKGRATEFPVPYRCWSLPPGKADFPDGTAFRAAAIRTDLIAEPVPGTDAGPWLKGTVAEHAIWKTLFDASTSSAYEARKGVTTDRNGIYFVRAGKPGQNGLVPIVNDPEGAGRTKGIPAIAMDVEPDHLFPLLRGRGLSAFRSEPDPNYKIILPQRGMHGDPALMATTRRTLRFFERFRDELSKRASYRRFQKGKPFWSTWSTGPYTFSPYKVLWKEMSGGRFCAAYVGEIDDPILGLKVAVPDHKLYMVALDHAEEAQFLTGILNAKTVAAAVGAYAAQLSLGTSVIDYLKIPRFDPDNADHLQIAAIARRITERGGQPATNELEELDTLAVRVVASHGLP